ncbi:outer membrane protein [Luteibacter sp. CQ10]|uniref:outer membrane protein n=1 Tax=Luteibacter sp. CQ10 TaxID=2805821 RepID=UPI0034A4A3E7
MHTSVLKATVAVVLLSSPFAALADSASVTQTGAFVSVTGGKSHFNVDRDPSALDPKDDSDGTGFDVLGGYRWVVARPFSLGVEGGYVNLGDTTWKGHYGGLSSQYDARAKTKVDGILVGINGKWDLPYELTVTARVGVSHMRARNHETDIGGFIFLAPVTTQTSHSTNSNRVYGGVGFGYDFNENIGLTLSYDRYGYKTGGPHDAGHTAHVGLLGLTAEYRFW